MAVAGEKIRIGALHGAEQEPVAYRPAVHEQELHLRRRAIVSGESRITCDTHVFTRGVDCNGIVGEVTSHEAREPLQPALEEIAFARAIERPFAVERKRERYVRARHGKPSDNVGGRKPFGTRGFEKLQSGRSGKKELTDL